MVLGVKIIFKTSLAVPGALAHRLQCRTVCNDGLPETPSACLIQNGQRGLEICQTLGFWIKVGEVYGPFY